MTLESWAFVAEIVGTIAGVASPVYVGVQIRESNRVNQATARHNISEFVLQASMFNADHADRIAAIQQKIAEDEILSGAETTIQWWSHMNMMLHAETCYHHYELGSMPDGQGRSASPGCIPGPGTDAPPLPSGHLRVRHSSRIFNSPAEIDRAVEIINTLAR